MQKYYPSSTLLSLKDFNFFLLNRNLDEQFFFRLTQIEDKTRQQGKQRKNMSTPENRTLLSSRNFFKRISPGNISWMEFIPPTRINMTRLPDTRKRLYDVIDLDEFIESSKST